MLVNDSASSNEVKQNVDPSTRSHTGSSKEKEFVVWLFSGLGGHTEGSEWKRKAGVCKRVYQHEPCDALNCSGLHSGGVVEDSVSGKDHEDH